MSYTIARVQKFTAGSVGGIAIHDERKKGYSHTNKDIDFEQSHLNYNLHPELDKSFRAACNERIRQLNLKRAVRKDAIVMAQVLITSDHGFFQELDKPKQGQFFKDSYDFLCNRYGKENCISSIVHVDERTPHMHFNFVPVTPDGRLSAKNLFTPTTLRNLQTEFHEQVGRKYGLERGVEGSKTKHLPVLEYKIETAKMKVEATREEVAAADFKKQERAKEVEELEIKKEHIAVRVSELQNTAHQLQGDIKLLEDEKKRLEGLKNALQGQIKTVQDELGKLDGKILTKHGIDKISQNKKVSRGIFGKDDMATLPDADFNSLVKTALASPRVETSEENKRLKAENEAIKTENEVLKTEVAKVQPLSLELDRIKKAVSNRDGKISELSESLDKQERRAEYWISKANTSEANYTRVLRELNDLKGRGKSRGHDRG